MKSHPPVAASVICNQFIFQASQSAENAVGLLTPMKLQKLVCISHGWMLGLHGWPLVREPAEVWHYGPVIASVYHAYKIYGGNYVTEEGRDQHGVLDELQYDLVRRVWEAYQDFTGPELSALTHKKGTPWDRTRRVGESLIPDPVTRRYYRDLAEKRRRAGIAAVMRQT